MNPEYIPSRMSLDCTIESFDARQNELLELSRTYIKQPSPKLLHKLTRANIFSKLFLEEFVGYYTDYLEPNNTVEVDLAKTAIYTVFEDKIANMYTQLYELTVEPNRLMTADTKAGLWLEIVDNFMNWQDSNQAHNLKCSLTNLFMIYQDEYLDQISDLAQTNNQQKSLKFKLGAFALAVSISSLILTSPTWLTKVIKKS